ncbi:MAG: DUF2490 domain-containing protein [Bacteroidales bacterium]|nr:DUF2490 domain-containing protein [Bacteroidales bacterium]
MKTRILILISSLCALLPFVSRAQGTVNDLETDFRGRVTLEADYKLSKGFHLNAEAEGRFSDNFSSFGRYHAGLGLSYKVSPWLKLGGGYLFIQNQNSSGEFKPRHRVYGDATLSHKSGYWRFSLKERLQLTHRDGVNSYQTTPNALALKSRFKVQYKGFTSVEPYAFLEARIYLNAPACSATWSGSAYSDYSFLGYTDTYFNRFRGGLGVEWKLDKKNAFDFYFMTDYCYDKEIDTNKEGTKLKSLVYEQTLAPTIGVGYKFSF